jgi:hypothetical protein
MPFICISRGLGEQAHAGTKPAMYEASAAMVASVEMPDGTSSTSWRFK